MISGDFINFLEECHNSALSKYSNNYLIRGDGGVTFPDKKSPDNFLKNN